MNKYRVLMKDSVNGETFHFAQYYDSLGLIGASMQAIKEYDCFIVKVDKVA